MTHFFKALLLFLLCPFILSAQATKKYNSIRKIDRGLYFMYYDSSNAKSTIVEFDFVVLLEVPIKDEGAGAVHLKDHIAGGEKVLKTLEKYFPGKPLKYLIHSHWHPHSISSVKPFLTKGVKLVTTKDNFKKLSTFVDSTTITRFGKQLQIIDGDSLIIKDNKNELVVYRFKQTDYPGTPTSDYLYFYLPAYNLLHCGCMYNKWEGGLVYNKEILTGREEDLNRFLVAKGLEPQYLIRLNNEKPETNDMITFATFENVINNGIRARDILNKYFLLDERLLNEKSDSIVRDIIMHNVPSTIINSGVYAALGRKKLEKALALAKIQVFVTPSDPNAWDTLGEVYYFMGEVELARAYEKRTKQIATGFNSGGETIWRKDLEDHRKSWENLKNN